MTTGWMIGVLIERPGGTAERFFYAVARADRAQAEWCAVDAALKDGRVAASPVGGLEPVQAIAELAAATLRSIGVGASQVKGLGPRWPRRWIGQPRNRSETD